MIAKPSQAAGRQWLRPLLPSLLSWCTSGRLNLCLHRSLSCPYPPVQQEDNTKNMAPPLSQPLPLHPLPWYFCCDDHHLALAQELVTSLQQSPAHFTPRLIRVRDLKGQPNRAAGGVRVMDFKLYCILHACLPQIDPGSYFLWSDVDVRLHFLPLSVVLFGKGGGQEIVSSVPRHFLLLRPSFPFLSFPPSWSLLVQRRRRKIITHAQTPSHISLPF